MRYALLLYRREQDGEEFPKPDDLAVHVAVGRDAVARGAYIAANALRPTMAATTVRVHEGRTVLADGPFAETNEALAGFYLFSCEDLDEAIAYAERLPFAWQGAVEIRPVADVPGWEEAIGLGARP